MEEAYSSAITDLDTGLLQRNFETARILANLLYFSFDRNARYVDVAGGYGALTRLMRDVGFDFRWADKYAPNLMARGFEAEPGGPHAAITAIEVLEHVWDPVAFLQDAMTKWQSRSVMFTTLPYEGAEPPAPERWWYYAFPTGQHISFYSLTTLKTIAARLELSLHSRGSFHLLTDRSMTRWTFHLLTGTRFRSLLFRHVRNRMPSRTWPDHQALLPRADQES